MRLSFGDFVIDFGERRLFSGRQEIRLTPKAFDLLRLLIENRPNAMSKQDIFERLWPGTFVTRTTRQHSPSTCEPPSGCASPLEA
jgi:DNA-binding winged helix-turn-helix (wHTH) protein